MEEITASYKNNLFSGQGVLVTGGSSGIGLGAARAFRALGAVVLATGVTQKECDLAAEDKANFGINFAPLDVRDGARIDQLLQDLPNLHVVVNAAGVIRRALRADYSRENSAE